MSLQISTRATIAADSSVHAPEYGGFLSNHLPMALAAYDQLGGSAEQIKSFRDNYAAKLDPIADDPKYASLFAQFTNEIQNQGATQVLHEHLPNLISGWVKEAYHPLIRLGYGVQFAIDSEIAAGLAYMAWAGPDPIMEAKVADMAPGSEDPFRTAATFGIKVDQRQIFNDRYHEALPQLGPLTYDAAASLATHALQALEIFAATHDFFALHLVTGSHAYREVYPYAGANRDKIYTLGLVAGYAALNCPGYGPLNVAPAEEDLLALIHRRPHLDEHDLKLAHSCTEHAKAYNSPVFMDVAARYLKR